MFRLTLRRKLLIRDTLIALVISVMAAVMCWRFGGLTVPEAAVLLYAFGFGAWIVIVGTNPVYPRMRKSPRREGFIDE